MWDGFYLRRWQQHCKKHTQQNSQAFSGFSHMHHKFFITAIKGSVCKYSMNSLVYPPAKSFLQCVGKGQEKLLEVSMSLFSSRKFCEYDVRTDFSSLLSFEQVPSKLLHSLLQSTGFLWFNELCFTFEVWHCKKCIIIKVRPFTNQKPFQFTTDVQIYSSTAINSTCTLCAFYAVSPCVLVAHKTLILTTACYNSFCSGLCCVIILSSCSKYFCL